MQPLLAAVVTFGAGLVLVPLVRALARRTGMVCAPRADRWHTRPTALLGGVGIFAAFAVGIATTPQLLSSPTWSTVAAATLLFAVGLVDDVVQLRPLVKLGFQLAAAGIFVARGRVLPWTHDPLLDGAITVVWVVGIGNAMNLLDNMDGLAAGIAAIASGFLAITFWMNGQAELLALPAIVAGASLAFLVFNFKPASIFMGDSGSLFLGTLLAGMGLLSSYGRSRSVASVLLTPVLIMAIPILDTTLVTITRRLRGQPVSVGGRDHTSHRLVALGASERRAVVILWVVAAASGAIALVVRELRVDALLAVIPAFALAVFFFALYLAMVPVRAGGRTAVADGRLPTPSTRATLLIDVAIAAIVYVTAFSIRWDWDLPDDQLVVLARSLPFVVAAETVCMWICGMYRVRWHAPSVDSLVVIGRCVLAASAVSALMVLAAHGFVGPSRGALVLNGILLMIGMTGSRLSILLLERVIAGSADGGATRPVLICAESERASFLVREMLDNPQLRLRPVGVVGNGHPVDDRVLGVPVLCHAELRQLVEREGVHDVLVPQAGIDRTVAAVLESLGLRLRTVRLAIE
jgi:UDP-GlcNAc:undecaprenyl-phosphate GlcNAc-1-phosphate transferase